MAQDVRAIADAQGLADIMVRDENAYIALLEVFDDALNIENGYGVDTGEGFVQQDESGVGRQGSRYLHASSFAAGQADANAIPDMRYL